jgi:hypothetical protein
MKTFLIKCRKENTSAGKGITVKTGLEKFLTFAFLLFTFVFLLSG